MRPSPWSPQESSLPYGFQGVARYSEPAPQGTSVAGIMPVGRGLKAGGLFTAEITTASTLKMMSTRKAKLHMDTEAITYLCVATMNQFTTECSARETKKIGPTRPPR
jgi:hypothetical protein